jgi:hypothetical protein
VMHLPLERPQRVVERSSTPHVSEKRISQVGS